MFYVEYLDSVGDMYSIELSPKQMRKFLPSCYNKENSIVYVSFRVNGEVVIETNPVILKIMLEANFDNLQYDWEYEHNK